MTYWTSTKNICTSCTSFVNSNMPSWGGNYLSRPQYEECRMISRWKWILKQTVKKLWFRATLFAIVAIITALLSILFKSMIPESVSVKVGAEAVDNILNILASSMLAVTTFSLSIMVTAYGSATTNVTPRATRLVVEDVTTQNVLATFIGSFLFSLVGIIALSMGAYGERGESFYSLSHWLSLP